MAVLYGLGDKTKNYPTRRSVTVQKSLTELAKSRELDDTAFGHIVDTESERWVAEGLLLTVSGGKYVPITATSTNDGVFVLQHPVNIKMGTDFIAPIKHGTCSEEDCYLAPEDWAAATAYVVGDIVQPTTANTYQYRCTVAGTSDGVTEPTWPTTVGTTVGDNGITWKTEITGTFRGVLPADVKAETSMLDFE